MPKKRRENLFRDLDMIDSFYDPGIQAALGDPGRYTLGLPVLVMQCLDNLVKGWLMEKKEFLSWFEYNQELVSELLVLVTRYHNLPVSEKSLKRRMLEEHSRWLEWNEHRANNDPHYSYRTLEWKEVGECYPGVAVQTLKNSFLELQNELCEVDSIWEEHIIEYRIVTFGSPLTFEERLEENFDDTMAIFNVESEYEPVDHFPIWLSRRG